MKFPGTCIVCNGKIEINEIGLYSKGSGVKHEKCSHREIEQNLQTKQESPEEIPTKFTLELPGTFKIIDDPNVIKTQQSKIENYFKKNSSKSGEIRLTQKGTQSLHSDDYFPVVEAHFNSEHDIWWSSKIDPVYKPNVQTKEEFEQPIAFTNVLGVGEPYWRPIKKGKQHSMAVIEINYNKDGSHTKHGYILEQNKNYYLGIDKVIGGVSDTSRSEDHKGRIQKYFLNNNNSVIKNPKPIFLIAEINENFIETLSKFVKNIKKIKDNSDSIPTSNDRQTIKSTYFLDEQYEEKSTEQLKELKKLKYSETSLNQEIDSIDLTIKSIPKKQDISTSGYPRNHKLRNLLKIKFKHTCQVCKETTFKNKDDDFYTESHHIVPLELGGEDKSKNILIVCANCHRKFHSADEETLIETYGELHKELLLSSSMLKKLYESKCISKKMFEKLNNSIDTKLE